ncbi:hypothetical protein NYR54_13265 [Chelativorans sp. SCAU2101]|jgi:hypothetical protein|uniref:Lipoprotein n=1 Tax=Chelativorans petroleitrophicus TaxID=2975484 RepID=A0A9X3B052_9HYPH|nr:hypothetical protein [Chelativorans petroleitrophicus]MCT8991250.1 hypothetical protein [Chelativorans petroleitrophicus]
MNWPRTLLIIATATLLTGCQVFGMAGAVRITGETFDEAECLAREFKGEAPCLPEEPRK